MARLRLCFLIAVIALGFASTCYAADNLECLPATASANDQYQKAKADVRYAECFEARSTAQNATCRTQTDPVQQRICLQTSILLSDLVAATKDYHRWARACEASRQPRDCQAQQEADQRLTDMAQTLVGM